MEEYKLYKIVNLIGPYELKTKSNWLNSTKVINNGNIFVFLGYGYFKSSKIINLIFKDGIYFLWHTQFIEENVIEI